ncbi:MAG: hypothetical protein LBL93_02180 [Ruminococcus sp.]|jgi:ABC-type transport system involved in multi-copper enzyme maturation permease subunit|nr:hypothetical protein [Ruminococcus sp.]
MLLKQFTVEFKRHIMFFLGLSFINIAFFIVSKIPDLTFVGDYIYPFYLMLSFTLAVIYIFIDLYNDLYSGKNVLALMVPFGENKIILSKSFAYAVGIILLWLTSLLQTFFGENGFYKVAIEASDSRFEGISYMALSRMVSVFSGIAIFAVIIALVRFFRNRFLSYVVSFVLFLGFSIGFCCVVLSFGSVDWFIGINSDVHVYNQYFGFVPIMIVSTEVSGDISDTIAWGNLLLNFIVGIFGYVVSGLILKWKRFDYVQI